MSKYIVSWLDYMRPPPDTALNAEAMHVTELFLLGATWGRWMAQAALAFALEHGEDASIARPADLIDGQLFELADGTHEPAIVFECERRWLSPSHAYARVRIRDAPDIEIEAVLAVDSGVRQHLDPNQIAQEIALPDHRHVSFMQVIALGCGGRNREVRAKLDEVGRDD